MAVSFLKDVNQLGSTKVLFFPKDAGTCMVVGDPPIVVNEGKNSLYFRIQNGPIKEVGVNGCQIDDVLEAVGHILYGFNQALPCKLTKEALDHVYQALRCLDERKTDREERGVEGTNQA